jgi:hypothetical protein
MKNWTIKEYQSLGMDGIQKLSDEDFHALAINQKDFFPDMLKICDEEEILRIFYRQYKRKYAEG